MKKAVAVISVCAVSICFAILFGSVKLTLSNIDVILPLRLPRVLLAFCVGGMLGLSGALLQLLLRNPLADGFTVGVASSSALGAVIGLSLGVSFYFLPVFGVVSGSLGLATVYFIATRTRNFSNITLILSGIVLNIICSSVISFMKFYFDESVGAIVFWLMGGIYLFDWKKVLISFGVLFAVLLYSFRNSMKLDILSFDEASAYNLGVEPQKVRRVFFVLASLLISVAVSFSGIIGFVGLIVPHIARGFFGASMKKNVIFSTLFGANLLVLSDLLSRVIIPSGAELPVGIITSILGGSFFLYLLTLGRRKMWYG